MLVVEHLVKTYRKAERRAVDDVSFTVDEGEFFSLLGPNGAGKTTTMSILTTSLLKTSGVVTVAGRDLDQHQGAVRAMIGVIFQQPSLDQNLTAEENIRLHAFLYGLYPFRPTYASMPEQYKDIVLSLAGLLELDRELFKPIKTFSGGMKRKLEIIRSLIHQPRILFLDEPSTGLDPASRKTLWEYLQDVRRKHGTTIFLTTHYLEEAESADRVCIMQDGRIVANGTPTSIKESLIEDYLLVDAKDRMALQRDLVKLDVPFDEGEPVRVELKDRTAQEIIRGIATPLSTLVIHTPTLEEAYLEIIGQQVKEAA